LLSRPLHFRPSSGLTGNSVAFCYFFRCFQPGEASKFFLFHEDQGFGRASFYACRDFPAWATVAFEGNPALPLPPNDSVGADHGAHPAANAFIGVVGDDTGKWVLSESSCAASSDARGVLAVAAEEGHLASHDVFHVEPAARSGGLRNGLKDVFRAGMLHSAGQLARVTSNAPVQPDKYLLHGSPPLNPQPLPPLADGVQELLGRFLGVGLHDEVAAEEVFHILSQHLGDERASQDRRDNAYVGW